MPNPQTENGYTRVANELLEAVLLADLGKREQKVVWAVIRQTYGYNKKEDAVSTHQIANLTGLDRSHVARCLRGLAQNGVILTRPSGIRRHGIEVPYIRVNKDYSQWQTGANSAPVQTSNTDAETAPVETEETGAKTARVPKQHGCQNSTGNGCQIGSETGAKTAPSKDITKDSKDRRGRSRAETKDEIADRIARMELPEWLPRDAWEAFVWERRNRRKDMTDKAASLTVKKLGDLREAGDDPREVIEQSIANSWTGVFALKDRAKGQGQQEPEEHYI